MSEGRVEPQDRGGTEREEREDIGGTERKRRRGGRRNGKSVNGRRTLTKRDHREKEKKLIWEQKEKCRRKSGKDRREKAKTDFKENIYIKEDDEGKEREMKKGE